MPPTESSTEELLNEFALSFKERIPDLEAITGTATEYLDGLFDGSPGAVALALAMLHDKVIKIDQNITGLDGQALRGFGALSQKVDNMSGEFTNVQEEFARFSSLMVAQFEGVKGQVNGFTAATQSYKTATDSYTQVAEYLRQQVEQLATKESVHHQVVYLQTDLQQMKEKIGSMDGEKPTGLYARLEQKIGSMDGEKPTGLYAKFDAFKVAIGQEINTFKAEIEKIIGSMDGERPTGLYARFDQIRNEINGRLTISTLASVVAPILALSMIIGNFMFLPLRTEVKADISTLQTNASAIQIEIQDIKTTQDQILKQLAQIENKLSN